ncbi:hypothetical protein WA158_003039 [Blastocystis sp. Blastoise]
MQSAPIGNQCPGSFHCNKLGTKELWLGYTRPHKVPTILVTQPINYNIIPNSIEKVWEDENEMHTRSYLMGNTPENNKASISNIPIETSPNNDSEEYESNDSEEGDSEDNESDDDESDESLKGSGGGLLPDGRIPRHIVKRLQRYINVDYPRFRRNNPDSENKYDSLLTSENFNKYIKIDKSGCGILDPEGSGWWDTAKNLLSKTYNTGKSVYNLGTKAVKGASKLLNGIDYATNIPGKIKEKLDTVSKNINGKIIHTKNGIKREYYSRFGDSTEAPKTMLNNLKALKNTQYEGMTDKMSKLTKKRIHKSYIKSDELKTNEGKQNVTKRMNNVDNLKDGFNALAKAENKKIDKYNKSQIKAQKQKQKDIEYEKAKQGTIQRLKGSLSDIVTNAGKKIYNKTVGEVTGNKYTEEKPDQKNKLDLVETGGDRRKVTKPKKQFNKDTLSQLSEDKKSAIEQKRAERAERIKHTEEINQKRRDAFKARRAEAHKKVDEEETKRKKENDEWNNKSYLGQFYSYMTTPSKSKGEYEKPKDDGDWVNKENDISNIDVASGMRRRRRTLRKKKRNQILKEINW